MRYIILVFIFFTIACSNEEHYFYELPNVEGGIRFPSEPKIVDIASQSDGKLVYWIGKDVKYFAEFEFYKTGRFKDKYMNERRPLIYFDSKQKDLLQNFNRLIYGLDTTDINMNNIAGIYIKDNTASRSIAYIHITKDYRFSFEVDFSSDLMLSKEEKWLLINNFIRVDTIMNYYTSLSKNFRQDLNQYDLEY